MKTNPSSAPQSSGYPLKIVEPATKENMSPVVPLSKENKAAGPIAKTRDVADTPGAWDESWFANYE